MGANKFLYLSGLNGIRAIAAVAVMISHINKDLLNYSISQFSLFGFNSSGAPKTWNLGEHGVTMFFVLSGFLITYLLLLEQRKLGTISQSSFYVRRILRIWPLYFLLLIVGLIITYIFGGDIPNFGTISLYVFLLANVPFILGYALDLCGHLWSVAVEEQFYLFWPFFFLKKIKNLKQIFIGIVIAMTIIRFALWWKMPFQSLTILFTVNRFDCMIFGAILAILIHEKHNIINIITSKVVQFLSWGILLIHFFDYEVINSIISMELMTFATGFIICGQVMGKNRIFNLENKVCNYLGRYSYGIYIYHPLFIFLFSKMSIFQSIENEGIRAIFVFGSIIGATLVVSQLSYEYFEKPFLKLKDRFSIIHSANSQKGN